MSIDIAASKLKDAFEGLLQRDYSNCIAPEPYITPTTFGRHIDTFLGGGLTSSLPVMFTSSPESGKSTTAFQFASSFLRMHQDAVVVYLDIENAAATSSNENIMGRVTTFGIDTARFMYKPIVAHLEQVFELINNLVNVKKKLEEHAGKEYKVLFIWDSLSSTPLNKELNVDDPNQVN